MTKMEISIKIESKKNPRLNSRAWKYITKMKNLLEEFKGRFEQAEKLIIKLEDRTLKIIESSEQKEKRLKKSK